MQSVFKASMVEVNVAIACGRAEWLLLTMIRAV